MTTRFLTTTGGTAEFSADTIPPNSITASMLAPELQPGQPNGIAELDGSGTVPPAQLDLSDYQQTTQKDSTGGYVGLTGFNLNFKNTAGTFTSYFTNSNTASRTYTFPNRTGSIADNTDITNAINTANSYSDSILTGLWNDRGVFDASGGAYPNSGGSGVAGAIIKGNIWTISVAGTLPTGQAVNIGDTVRALIDSPGNTQANWAIGENNIGYVPENTANKNSSGGYVGLTNFDINFKDTTGNFTSYFTNSNGSSRTYTLPDVSGTVALLGATQSFTKQNTLVPQALTQDLSGFIAWNVNNGNSAGHTAVINSTLENPTNMVNGTILTFRWKQHPSSAKTLAFGSKWKFLGGSTVSNITSSVALITGIYNSTDDVIEATMATGVFA